MKDREGLAVLRDEHAPCGKLEALETKLPSAGRTAQMLTEEGTRGTRAVALIGMHEYNLPVPNSTH